MAVVKVLMDQSYILKGRYRLVAKVLKVDPNPKHLNGIKAKFLLLDLEQNKPIVLVDNHEPFGFHFHVGLPKFKNKRQLLDVKDFNEAYGIFLKTVEQIIFDEN